MILLLLISFALSQSSIITLLTPSPYISHIPPYTSKYGMRQAYLIGQELFTSFNKSYINIYSDSSVPSSQTALGVSRGLYLAGFGSLIESNTMQNKSIPPIKEYDFRNWSENMRDQVLPYYSTVSNVKSLRFDEDVLFHAEEACISIKKVLMKKDVNCSENDTAKEACKELEDYCKKNITKAYDACECFNSYRSEAYHNMAKNLSNASVDFMKKECDNYHKNLLNDTSEVEIQKLLTEKLFSNFKINLNSTNNLTIYIISELQMKAVIHALTSEFMPNIIEYGSMLVLKREFDQKTSHVNLLFNKKELNILNNTDMDYESFTKWIEEQRLRDYEYTCNPYDTEEKEDYKWIIIVSMIILGVILVGIGVALLIKKIVKRHKDKADDVENDNPDNPDNPDNNEIDDNFLAINKSVVDLEEQIERKDSALSEDEL